MQLNRADTRLKGDPKECVYCKSSNFIHERTHGNSRILDNTREVLINKNFFCNECKKYFSTQDEIVVTADLETFCKHPLLEKSYTGFYYPGTETSYDGIWVSFCLSCGVYLLTCNVIKTDLEEALPDFWNNTWAKPFLYCASPCKYCTGEYFEDTNQEISHATAKALVLLKEENTDLFNFLYNNDESGILQLEKQLNIATERYFRIRNSGTYPSEFIESLMNERRKYYKAISDKQKEFHQYVRKARNYYRERFNLPKIGGGWVSETKLFKLIKNYFKEYEVYFHYRQSWLNGLELDIFVPDKKLAIEYMGKQHYEPVKFFGGTDSHIATTKRDKIKKELCAKYGIDLIYFDYQTDVTKDNLRLALENYKSNN